VPKHFFITKLKIYKIFNFTTAIYDSYSRTMEKTNSNKRKTVRRGNRQFRFNNAVSVVTIAPEGMGRRVGNTYKTRTRRYTVQPNSAVSNQSRRKYAVAVLSAQAFSKGNTLEDMVSLIQKSRVSTTLKAETIKYLQTKFSNLSKTSPVQG